jgi:hypothetical protein
MPSFPPPRALVAAMLACSLAACDDAPTQNGVVPPPNAAFVLGQDGRVQVVTGSTVEAPRTVARVGGLIVGCATRLVRDRSVLVVRTDSAGASRRFTFLDDERGTVRRELPFAQLERTFGDTARLDLFAPVRCNVDAAGSRVVTNARLGSRIGLAVVSLDSARVTGFLRTDGFQSGTAFTTWRGRPALMVARYPTPFANLARLFLYAHDPATLAVFDSTLVPGSEQTSDVRILPLPGQGGVSVVHNGRISYCAQFGCSVPRLGAPWLQSLTTWDAPNVTGFTFLLGTTTRFEGGRVRGEAWVLTPNGDPQGVHDLGEMRPIDITVDRLTGLWVVAGSLRGWWCPGPCIGPADATVIVTDPGLPIRIPLPDVIVVYDPVERRVVRRDAVPVGTLAVVGVR